MDLKRLKDPFKEKEIEWRIGSCGKKGNGQIWAMCLAYVQARAIMDRLDDVCGPENWRVEYSFIAGSQTVTPGVIARIFIKAGAEWVCKEDGAEQTDIEAFKGGLSSALKRAGAAWGIGRYLYNLEAGFANIVSAKTDKSQYGKTKEGSVFEWEPPRLPKWALPDGEPVGSNGVHPGDVASGDGINTPSASYTVPFGKYARHTLESLYDDPRVGAAGLTSYIEFLEAAAKKKGIELAGQGKEFVEQCSAFLGAMENAWDPNGPTGVHAENGGRR